MEGANIVVPLVRADALCGDSQEAEDHLRKGADRSAPAIGKRRCDSTAGVQFSSSGSDVFAERGRRKAGAHDGVIVRLGLRAFQDETEFAAAMTRESAPSRSRRGINELVSRDREGVV